MDKYVRCQSCNQGGEMKEPLKHTGKLHSMVSKEWLEWTEQEIQSIQSENAALKAQVKRLREALYKIIDTWSKSPEDEG